MYSLSLCIYIYNIYIIYTHFFRPADVLSLYVSIFITYISFIHIFSDLPTARNRDIVLDGLMMDMDNLLPCQEVVVKWMTLFTYNVKKPENVTR